MNLHIIFYIVLTGLLTTGCVVPSPWIEPWVKPYERQNLTDPIMSSRHPLDDYYMSHVYENRESARGADGGTGGGCGCN